MLILVRIILYGKSLWECHMKFYSLFIKLYDFNGFLQKIHLKSSFIIFYKTLAKSPTEIINIFFTQVKLLKINTFMALWIKLGKKINISILLH